MPTVPYNTALKDMIADRPEMALEMLEDAMNSLMAGDVEDGRLLLRQYVNVTIGFQELARITGKHDKNLMRTLGKDGNPTATNLFEIVRACIDAANIDVVARVLPRGATPAPA